MIVAGISINPDSEVEKYLPPVCFSSCYKKQVYRRNNTLKSVGEAIVPSVRRKGPV